MISPEANTAKAPLLPVEALAAIPAIHAPLVGCERHQRLAGKGQPDIGIALLLLGSFRKQSSGGLETRTRFISYCNTLIFIRDAPNCYTFLHKWLGR